MRMVDLSGVWNVVLNDETLYTAILPGTLDTNKIGYTDEPSLESRFTRVHTYEGVAVFKKKIDVSELRKSKERIFLEIERARELSLKIGEHSIPEIVRGTMSTPYVFELTNHLIKDEIELEISSDNSYPTWPRKSILTSSAATDETQTNWNGLIGYIRLRTEQATFVQATRIYPIGNVASIHVEINTKHDYNNELMITSPAFVHEYKLPVSLTRHQTKTIILENVEIKVDALKWDEEDGHLQSLMITGPEIDPVQTSFGIRDFGINERKRLTINGREFFLRGESNCAVFPMTGHPPMTKDEWHKVLTTYASYGVNCMRFHSWCPPKAAFEAADEMGMMMQPELSCWNPSTAFESNKDQDFYELELTQILKCFANHPSFVMFTFGNEPWNEEVGMQQMNKMLDMCFEIDPTRMYAHSSNAYYGQRGADPKSQFYTSFDVFTTPYKEDDALHIRAYSAGGKGHLNEQYPNAKTNFDSGVNFIQNHYNQAVFGFEVGQSQIFPDFKEIETFTGVTRAKNFEIIKANVERNGMLDKWEEWVNATGEIAYLAYREEVEAVLRTENMSGLSLLGLQDFPGQGTAIVGFINSHLQPKPYDFAKPERFKTVFNSKVLLLYLDKYTYSNDETLVAELKLANYSKGSISGAATWRLRQGDITIKTATFTNTNYENQGLRYVGEVEINLDFVTEATRFDIDVELDGIVNTYPIWIYPKSSEKLELTAEFANVDSIRVATYLDDETLAFLEQGGLVFLEPNPTKETMPKSVGGQFATEFWSVKTFEFQEGGMGMVVEENHPVLEKFPTDGHTNWQWWPMTNGRPMILPNNIKPILTVPDSYCYLKHMGLLFEAKVGAGKIVVSGMGLRFKQKYPEVRALINCIISYMSSNQFTPSQEITMEQLSKLVKK